MGEKSSKVRSGLSQVSGYWKVHFVFVSGEWGRELLLKIDSASKDPGWL